MAVASVIYSLPIVFQTLLLSIVQSFNRWVIFQPESQWQSIFGDRVPDPAARERLWGLLSSAVEPMRGYDLIKSLAESREYSTRLQEVNSQLLFPIANAEIIPQSLSNNIISQLSIIFKAIAEDDDAISSFLYDVLSSKDKKARVSSLAGEEAEKFMNLMHIVRAKDYLLVAEHSHFQKRRSLICIRRG